ncbi:hypothetical protein EVG20_g745 [Dentipellis fragilis]|uniref:G-protein coupled receptors family 1 profile domain-containing protein n=1 Tax=Dentipellis fragilis TaxID=205917 RepID=A0A4Y9ZEG1_9AGAM|nr:hypothetical protein EVG20_g745 [Dentipellis fragilis]
MSQCGAKEYRITISSLWAGSVLHGFYTALFAGSIYVLAFQRLNKYYLATTIILYILITTGAAFDLAQVLSTPKTISGAYFSDGGDYLCDPDSITPEQVHEAVISNLFNVVHDVLNVFSQIAADGLLIFRCFVIWERKIRIVLPLIILLTATTVCNLVDAHYDYELYKMSRAAGSSGVTPPGWFRAVDMSSEFANAGVAMMLATTVLTTIATAGRIWWTLKRLGRRSIGGAYRSAILMLVESGMLYSSALIVQLIIQQTAAEYIGIFPEIQSMLSGIAPTLIIVRVGMGRSFETTHVSAIQTQNNTMQFAKPATSTMASAAGHSGSDSTDTDSARQARITIPIAKASDGDISEQLGEAEKYVFLSVQDSVKDS